MTGSSQWERAEAVFGHLQHAACEMIAAAHDALEILDQVVSTAGLGQILAMFGGSAAPPPTNPGSGSEPIPESPTAGGATRRTRHHTPVERISIR